MRNGGKDVRSAILDAAERALSSRGYKRMTIDDLAAEVGIGKGSVYLHFRSKEEIALSHIDRIIERLKRKLIEIAETEIAADGRLRLMLVERVVHRFDAVAGYKKSLNEVLAAVRPALLERRKIYFRDEAAIFARVIRDGQEVRVFADSVDAADAAGTIILATNSLLPLNLGVDELGSRSEIADRAAGIADLLIAGLKRGTG